MDNLFLRTKREKVIWLIEKVEEEKDNGEETTEIKINTNNQSTKKFSLNQLNNE